MTENEILKILSENDGYFTQSSIITDALSNIGWVIIGGFRKLVNGIDNILEEIYTIFGFSTSEPVQEFLNQSFPILICLMGLGVIYLGYCFMVNKVDNKTNIFRNFLLIVLVVTCLPIFVTQMNNITIGAIDAVRSTYTENGNIADEMISSSIVDLKYMDSNKFNFENIKKNNLTADTLSAIDITETVDPEDDTLKNKGLFESYTIIDSSGDLKLEKIDYGGWLDIFPKFYYRYNVEWLTIFMLLISVGAALLFTCYKVARIIIDIAIHQFLAYLFAVTDFTSGQRLREVLKSMLSLFTVVFLTTVILKFYFLAQAYFKALCDAGTIGTFTYALLLVIAALAVIDGPNVIERVLGVDAGIKSGYHALIGGLALARGAASAGRLARNVAIGDPMRNTKYDDKGNRKRELGGLFGGAKKAASGIANGAAKSAGVFSGFNSANKKAATGQNKKGNGPNKPAETSGGIDPNALNNIIANDPLGANIAMQPSGVNGESVASGLNRMGVNNGNKVFNGKIDNIKGAGSRIENGNVQSSPIHKQNKTGKISESKASSIVNSSSGGSGGGTEKGNSIENLNSLISSEKENEKLDDIRRKSIDSPIGGFDNNDDSNVLTAKAGLIGAATVGNIISANAGARQETGLSGSTGTIQNQSKPAANKVVSTFGNNSEVRQETGLSGSTGTIQNQSNSAANKVVSTFGNNSEARREMGLSGSTGMIQNQSNPAANKAVPTFGNNFEARREMGLSGSTGTIQNQSKPAANKVVSTFGNNSEARREMGLSGSTGTIQNQSNPAANKVVSTFGNNSEARQETGLSGSTGTIQNQSNPAANKVVSTFENNSEARESANFIKRGVGITTDVVKTIGKDTINEKLNNSDIKANFVSGQQKGKYYQSVVEKAKEKYKENQKKGDK